MTDLTEMQSDAMENAQRSKEAAESGDSMTLRVTLSIAVMTVIAASIGALSETESSHTFVEKNDAVLAQARASDTWSAYQAESVKRHIYEAMSTIATQPDAVARMKEDAAKYAREQPETQDKARKFEEQVASFSEKAESHFARHHVLMIAESLVHVAVAGASIALLARRRPIWIGSLALTAIGMIIAVAAYLT